MNVLVTGSRDWDLEGIIQVQLLSLKYEGKLDLLIHGGASGADTIADNIATQWGIPIKVYPANWGKYHRAAGPIRNTLMLDENQVDLVLAFRRGNIKSKGTTDMIKKAERKGIPVHIFEYEDYNG